MTITLFDPRTGKLVSITVPDIPSSHSLFRLQVESEVAAHNVRNLVPWPCSRELGSRRGDGVRLRRRGRC